MRATCGREESITYKVSAFLCSDSRCKICGKIWEALWEAPTEQGRGNTFGSDAVEGIGNEPVDLVQKAEGEEGPTR